MGTHQDAEYEGALPVKPVSILKEHLGEDVSQSIQYRRRDCLGPNLQEIVNFEKVVNIPS